MTALFYLSKLILLPFVSVTVVMFYVSLQADHLIVTKQLVKKVFSLNNFLLVPICFVLLFKKFQQLVSLFILSVRIQLKFCSFEVLKFDYEKFIDLNRFFVSVIVVMFFVSLEADHLIIKKKQLIKFFV